MNESFPKTFCLAPFLGMRQNAYGDMSPCPFGAGEWPLGHLPVQERYVAEPWNQLRKSFLEGEKPKECSRCWTEEAAGKKSMRQDFLEKRDFGFELVKSEKWKEGPSSLTIKLSNVCNLACKTCWGMETNRYRLEGIHYQDAYGEKNNPYLTPRPPTHLSEADAIAYANFSGNLKVIEFFGGEPLLNKTHWILLEEIVKKNRSKEIDLYYSTNTTNYPQKELIELWKNFKQVRFGLSIDGVGAGFKYMRWPGDFSAVQDNIRRMKTELKQTLAESGTNIEITGTMTLSSLNIFNLEELYRWLTENTNNCYISLVQSPHHLSIVNLPETVKPKIAERLLSAPYLSEFQPLVRFMQSRECSEKEWAKFVFWIERQDRYRNLFLKDVYPEYWDILKEEYERVLSEDLSAANLWKLIDKCKN